MSLLSTSVSGVATSRQNTASLTSRTNLGSRVAFGNSRYGVQPQKRQSLQVQNAITKEKKNEIVADLVAKLDSSAVVVGYHHKGISVKSMQELRRKLPAGSKLVVCKNTLMKVAIDQTQGWEDLKPACEFDNAWIFVPEEIIAESVKAFLAFEKQLDDKLAPDARGKNAALPLTAGLMAGGGGLLDFAQVKKLEKMPTKLELIATIARLIRAVPTKVAVSIKQVPTKLAYSVKALADGDDNKELLVGAVFPKAPAADAS